MTRAARELDLVYTPSSVLHLGDVGYRCVGCRSALTVEGDGKECACPGCLARYPILRELPILVRDPDAHLAASAAALDQLGGELDDRAKQISDLIARGARREALVVLRDAFAANARWFGELRAQLGHSSLARPQATSRSRVRDRAELGYLVDVIDYLRQDWSQLPDCRDDVATIVATIVAKLATHAPNARRGLVLGAGLGRFAWELRHRFERIIAIDLSMVMALTYAAVRDGEVRAFEINERVAYDRAGVARELVARIPSGAGELAYAVADARALPVADGSVDVVISAFFTDVVRLSALMPEVRRVLAPDGVFVHFGPLGYHFYAPQEMDSAEEVRARFARYSFELRDETWVQVWLMRSLARMSNARIDAWAFAAIKREARGWPP